jgi:hypothetical protein
MDKRHGILDRNDMDVELHRRKQQEKTTSASKAKSRKSA